MILGGVLWISGPSVVWADGPVQVPREPLLKALTSYRLRQTCLFVAGEAYQRIEETLQNCQHPQASVPTFYRGLVAVEQHRFEAARQLFLKCSQEEPLDSQLSERARLWSASLELQQLPSNYTEDRSPQVNRLRIALGQPIMLPTDSETPPSIDAWYVRLASEELTINFNKLVSQATQQVTLESEDSSQATQLVYNFYDPLLFSFNLLRNVAMLRREAKHLDSFHQTLLMIWADLLQGGKDAQALRRIQQAKSMIEPLSRSHKELLALEYTALNRLEQRDSAVQVLSKLRNMEWLTNDEWVLRGLSLECSDPAEIQNHAFQSVQRESGKNPLAPKWIRTLKRSEQPSVISRLAFYHEIGWLYLCRELQQGHNGLMQPASRNVLRADHVSHKINQLLPKTRSDELLLAKVMQIETAMRAGDWELWQNELRQLRVTDHSEIDVMLPLARFVAGRLRTGDPAANDSELLSRESENFAEKQETLLTGIGLLAPESSVESKGELASNSQPLNQYENRAWKNWPFVLVFFIVGIVCWILRRRRSRQQVETKYSTGQPQEDKNVW